MENDLISRRAAIEKFEPWLKVNGYSEGELNMLKAVLYELRFLPSVQPEILACGEGELNVPDTNVADCSDCIKHGGDWDCDHVHCHKGKSAQPERKKGKWIHHTDWEYDGECGYECSVCGMGSDVDYDFCMRCGSDMRQ